MVHVLILAASHEARAAYRALLAESALIVAEAPDAQTALGILQSSLEPLVVLLEVTLQRMGTPHGGMGLLRAVSRDTQLVARHRYIMVTALLPRQIDLAEELARLLATTIVFMPFNAKLLRAAVHEAAQQLDGPYPA